MPVGTVLAVRAGEQIPLDGVMASGSATVDESAVTGEPTPRRKAPGDALCGGTILQNGYLTFRTSSTAADSTVAQIQDAVSEAQAQAHPAASIVDRFARLYTPVILGVAVAVMALPPLLLAQPAAPWLHSGLLILVLACPCSLVLAAPVATACAIAGAAQGQVVVKTGGRALDALARMRLLATDKTNTLTEGHFRVTDVYVVGEKPRARGCACCPTPAPVPDRAQTAAPAMSWDTALRYAAALEYTSTHPLAAAVLAFAVGGASDGCLSAAAAAKGEGYGLPRAEDVRLHAGQGLEGVVEGHRVLVGNQDLMLRRLPLSGLKGAEVWMRWRQRARTLVFIAVDGELRGVLGLSDRPKEGARDAVGQLRGAGVAVVMLTGDTKQSAAAVSRATGIAQWQGGLDPEAKLRFVRARRDAGAVVGMVGDGINDGPALAHADLGIAMGSGGTALASQASEVVLMSDRLGLIPALRRLAQRCQATIARSVGLSIAVKAAMMTAALVTALPMWTAVVADALSIGLVVANGMTLLAPLKESSAGAKGVRD